MEWQPIETAPKDGTRILCYSSDCGDAQYPIHVVRWYDGEWVCQYDCRSTWKPSHWMDLPPPPKKKHHCKNEHWICAGNDDGKLVTRTGFGWAPCNYCPVCGEKAGD